LCIKDSVQSKRTVLFLSRIHPKKGIEILIEAWSKLDISIRQNWQIKIAGNGDDNYILNLKKLIEDMGLENEIFIIGPQFNLDKLNVLQTSDLFVLPTYSENFGIVVLEALANCIPVITTKGAPWEDLKIHGAGWWIDIGVDPLVIALTEALQLENSKLHHMGMNGRKLVENNYTIEIVAQKMIKLYEWVLGKSTAPEFIQFD